LAIENFSERSVFQRRRLQRFFFNFDFFRFRENSEALDVPNNRNVNQKKDSRTVSGLQTLGSGFILWTQAFGGGFWGLLLFWGSGFLGLLLFWCSGFWGALAFLGSGFILWAQVLYYGLWLFWALELI
jgi:hypothetical protein